MMKIIFFCLKTLVILLLTLVAITLMMSNSAFLGGVRSFVVQTGSMEPEIPVGSLIYVVPQSQYVTNEVITFKRGDMAVTHRIVGVKGENFETKGDANPAADSSLVKKADVYGRNQLLIPEVGKLINFLKTLPGFMLLVVLPTLVFVGFEARSMKMEWEKQLEKKILARLKEIQEGL